MVLVMIGFFLGNSLTLVELKKTGRSVFAHFHKRVVLVTTVLVSAGLCLIGVPLPLSLLCGGIASSTDPAATMDVINELKLKNQPAQVLLRIVAGRRCLGTHRIQSCLCGGSIHHRRRRRGGHCL